MKDFKKTKKEGLHALRRNEDRELFTLPPRSEGEDFTQSDPWRALRILSEFVEGFDALSRVIPSVAVFGSARLPDNNPWYKAAQETSRILASEGINIISGGAGHHGSC